MSDPDPKDPPPAAPKQQHAPPPGASTTATWNGPSGAIAYTATAGWTVLRKRDKPHAEMFSVAYTADGETDRPVTFVFNGGPGASSAYLHMGAVGPVRVAFPADGKLPRMPPRLVPNQESWLAFTDLVFIDPVGTGFSRAIDGDGAPKDPKKSGDDERPEREYYGYKRDLESLSEFIGRWLSAHRRWGSPVLIAGESYGGYRVGRLIRVLQEDAGIGLSGAIMISPVLELESLMTTDYDVLGWIDLLPTMALAAAHHGRSRVLQPGAPAYAVVAAAEAFATGDYATLLTRGASLQDDERARILERLADLIGLPAELVVTAAGRVSASLFARELLREQGLVLGLYDATVTAVDPFPDREPYSGPDPTLSGIEPAYTAAVNRQLRTEIGVDTDREYLVLSEEVNQAWTNDAPEHFFAPPRGATDDVRYGMTLNPHLRVFITHGRYDLVTPFYSTDRLRNLMRLGPDAGRRLTVQHFDGGHMFYAWQESRRAFTAAIAAFVGEALDQ